VRFERKGPMAIAASAYGQEYELVKPATPTLEGGVAVIMIMGPLSHHGEWWGGDTYDEIEDRVAAALATSAETVVLKIASPGGEADGAFECSKTLRRMASLAGKRLIAYVDELACSAAYALACAASGIYLPASGMCGSVGVIECLYDETQRDVKEGLSVAVITNGARKADGSPHVPLSDETRAVVQARVDGIAALFFDLVAKARGMSAEDVIALQAGIYQGANAVAAKLADAVMNWDELLAMLAGGEQKPAEAAAESGSTEAAMPNYAKALEAIQAALAEDAPAQEPEKKEGDVAPMDKVGFVAAVKKAMGIEDPAPPAHKEPDGDEVPPPAPTKTEEPAKDEEKAKASAEMAAVQALAEEAKAALIASRPDLDAKVLEGESLAVVRRLVVLAPKPAVKPAATNPAAAAQVVATAGAGQVSPPRGMSSNAELNARMHLTAEARTPQREGLTLVLPTLTATEAEALIAARNGGK
jgi:ClpP class serine protease